ncbi:uncharacterized protein LOC116300956 [Actinia tenebrosa]|uniref:Uncharacterized protein LOC116300956 n=1 Tax=Actinia tenebrosa TaxID=6105 RepID=A0A6P8IGA3_ACTTE|nr:uncharacterized protein LOC116300956 [Actinia tenebrosa]
MKRGTDLRNRISSKQDEEPKKPRFEKREEFDLIPVDKKSSVFKVAFDYYTPRSHFVILPRDGGPGVEGNDYNNLSTETKQELVRVASAIVSEYKLKTLATLSVHRGSWITTKRMFHAHVCADVDDYIKVFKKKEKQIPDWPSSRYVTKQWRASRDPRDYEANVRGYPFRTYMKEEIQDIEIIRKRGHAKPSPNKDKDKGSSSASSDTCEGFTLLYHPTEPRVGFAAVKKSNFTAEDYLQVLDVMNKYAGENNLTDINSKGDDRGCHLCVVFNADLKHGFEFGSSTDDDLILQGYLQLSGPKYYRDFCPEDMKESWFEKFSSNVDYKVYT